MAVTILGKRALFWGLGILALLGLVNVAWAQIAAAVGRCFSQF